MKKNQSVLKNTIINQISFWGATIILVFLFKDIKSYINIDFNNLFYKGPLNNLSLQSFLENVLQIDFIGLIDCLSVLVVLWIYYHFSTLIINGMSSPFISWCSNIVRLLLNKKLYKSIILTSIPLIIFFNGIVANHTTIFIIESLLFILFLAGVIFFFLFIKEIVHKLYFWFLSSVSIIIFLMLNIYFFIYSVENIDLNYCITVLTVSLLYTIFFGLFYILIITILLSIIFTIVVAEYNSAKIGKQIIENNVIIKKLENFKQKFGHNQVYKLCNFTKLYKKIINSKSNGNFKSRVNELVLNEALCNKTKNEILKYFNSIRVSESKIKHERANYIRYRNSLNLYISIATILVMILIILISIYFTFKITFIKNLLIIIYLLVFFRLLSRSFEICIAFYKDFTSGIKVKNTLLSGTDRIKLALYSLVEIAFTVALLYIIETLYKGDSLKLIIENYNFLLYFKIIFFNLFSGISASIFNISFPSINISFPVDSGMMFDIRLIEFNHLFIHVIQVITSLTLLTLSVANYINLPKYSYYYKILYRNEFYHLYKVINIKSSHFKKKIMSINKINNINISIQSEWEKGNLTDNEYLELKEFINLYNSNKK